MRTTDQILSARAELRSKITPLRDQLDGLRRKAESESRDLDSGEQEKVERLDRGLSKLLTEDDLLAREYVRALAENPANREEAPSQTASGLTIGFRGNPYAMPNRPESAAEVRARALTAIERWDAGDLIKNTATATVERAAADHTRGVAAHVLRYSDPLYVSAFRKYVGDPQTFAADLTPDERRVWAANREEARAALQTSGAVLPSPLDPTLVLTNDGTIDPMRGIARVQATTSDKHRFVTSAGSTFSFEAELTEVSDDTPTLGEVTVNVEKAQGFLQASIEVWQDQPGFPDEVAKLIADGKARLEGTKFIDGSGTNEPAGLQTGLDGTSSEVAPTTAETFAAADVYKVLEALPARFRGNARWMAELSTLNDIDQMETTNGAKLFPEIGSASPMLLRRPVVENSNVDPASGINAAATADHFILYVGDFQQGYAIVDRIGLSVAFLSPGILQNTTTNLPDGRVGWYAYWRTGGKVLTAAAVRVLSIPTTA
jgi:HK97 family phage major capsid protein